MSAKRRVLDVHGRSFCVRAAAGAAVEAFEAVVTPLRVRHTSLKINAYGFNEARISSGGGRTDTVGGWTSDNSKAADADADVRRAAW